jgi:hypothetical protein
MQLTGKKQRVNWVSAEARPRLSLLPSSANAQHGGLLKSNAAVKRSRDMQSKYVRKYMPLRWSLGSALGSALCTAVSALANCSSWPRHFAVGTTLAASPMFCAPSRPDTRAVDSIRVSLDLWI